VQVAVDVADQPGTAALAQQRDNALVGAAAGFGQGLVIGLGKNLWLFAERFKVFVDIFADGFDPRLCLDRFDLCMGVGDGAAKRLGQAFVNLARNVVERLALVEAAHVDRPFDGLAAAVQREFAAAVADDGDDAAVYFGRIGCVDLEFGFARGFALFEGRIIEERKFHRPLDLEHAVPGEEYRGGVGVDALYVAAAIYVPGAMGRVMGRVMGRAMRRGVSKKREHFVLAFCLVTHEFCDLLADVCFCLDNASIDAVPEIRRAWRDREVHTPGDLNARQRQHADRR
jgi:hypothetical protein